MMKRLGLALFFAVIGITVIAWQTVYAAMPQIDPQAYSSNAPSSIYNQIIRGNIRFRIADQIFSGANIFVEVVGQLNNFVAQTFTDTSGNYEVRIDRSLYTITPSAANRQFRPPSIGLDSRNGATGQVYNWNNFEATPVFTNLSATLQENQATFQFSFSDQTSDYHIDLSTLSDMSSDTYLSFGRGGNGTVTVSNPKEKWDKYACGRTLYWRVWTRNRQDTSPIQTVAVDCPFEAIIGSFSNLSGDFRTTSAEFIFRYNLMPAGTRFIIDISTRPDMSSDTYLNYARSEIGVHPTDTPSFTSIFKYDAPMWDKYRCGRTLYWRVLTENRRTASPIQQTTVGCDGDLALPPFTFSNMTATLSANTATFNFTPSIPFTESFPYNYSIELSTRPNMDWDVYLSFAEGTSGPFTVSDPGTLYNKWDKYFCGQTLYWRAVFPGRIFISPIQSVTVQCTGGVG